MSNCDDLVPDENVCDCEENVCGCEEKAVVNVDEENCDTVPVAVDEEVNNDDKSCKKENKLALVLNDIYSSNYNAQCITLAVLSNYLNEKEESLFTEVNLPTTEIKYDALKQIFFNQPRNCFSPDVLNIMWKSLTNFSLASLVLNTYEEQKGVSRRKISPVKMIELNVECAFQNLTEKIASTISINLNQLNVAFGSVNMSDDDTISANIVFHLYFNSLDVGLKFIFNFAVSDVPQKLIGVFNSQDKMHYDFDTIKPVVENRPKVVIRNNKK